MTSSEAAFRTRMAGGLLVAALVACTSSPASSGPQTCVGVLGPISENKNVWESAYLAAYLALEQANRSGGVVIGGQPRTLRLEARDDGDDPVIGLKRVAELHALGCDLVVGPGGSSTLLGPQPAYDPAAIDGVGDYAIHHHLLLISPAATSPEVTALADDGYVWRTAPSDALQGQVAAEAAAGRLGARRASIIHRDDAYGNGLAAVFSARFQALGGQVLASVAYPADVRDFTVHDFSAQVDAALQGGPDLIFLVVFEEDGAKLTVDLERALPATGRPRFMGTDSLHDQFFLDNGHPAILDGMIGIFPVVDDTSPQKLGFDAAFQARFGYPPQSYSQQSYDAASLLILAMLQTGSDDPAVLKDRLQTLTWPASGAVEVSPGEFDKARAAVQAGLPVRYLGASGHIEFDAAGDPSSATYLVYQVVRDGQGKFTFDTLEVVRFPAGG